MLVDCVYYQRGVRQHHEPMTLEQAAALPRRGGNYVWIELDDPTPEVLADLRRHFGLHELAVEDAGREHQRPKVESYDDFHFLVFRTAWHDERTGQVSFGELDLFIGTGYVIAVRHGEAGNPIRTRLRLERHPELLKRGPATVVWGILDVVVDDYLPVVEWLEDEVAELERGIFSGREDLTEPIYVLKRQLDEVYRAMHPLLIPLHALERGDAFADMDVALKRYFRDIADQIQRLQDEVLALREQLTVALEAHLSLLRVRQNELAAQQGETIGRLTLVATVFLPLTFVTGFFGQNFGWLVSHTGSFTAFLISALAFLVVPCLVLGGWLVLRSRVIS